MYSESFKRNIGWVTQWEQQVLRGKRVAVAGMGGVGGAHVATLARLGIGAFNIADFDRFEFANFNRQMGAFVNTVGREKTSVIAEMARGINPELDLNIFRDGVTDANIDSFLGGVDLLVDGLDSFALEPRAKLFARCAELGIPAVSAAPLGMGTAYFIYRPGHMTFEEYFRLDGLKEQHKYVHFFLGLGPRGYHRGYIAEYSRLDLINKRVPSIGAACMMCAGVAGIEALKLLLGRGDIYPLPYYHHLDVYREKFVRGRLRGGNRNPLQRLKLFATKQAIKSWRQNARPDEAPPRATPIERILDMARWTPSGDNSQPWRFHLVNDHTVRVDLGIEADDVMSNSVIATLLSGGMMLEIMAIAAGKEGKTLEWKFHSVDRVGKEGNIAFCFEVIFKDNKNIPVDTLHDYIPLRHTSRKYFKTSRISDAQMRELEQALGDHLVVTWKTGWKERLRVGLLNMQAFTVRMGSKSAYEHLNAKLDWNNYFPDDKLSALGLPATRLSRAVMRWSMASWQRMKMLGKLPGALLPSALELELLPALFCGGHFIISRKTPLPQDAMETLMEEGRGLMRFWLTLTKLGLVMQPSYTTIVFSHFGDHPEQLPPDEFHLAAACRRLSRNVEAMAGHLQKDIVFAGRLGTPRGTAVPSRSLRKKLDELIVKQN